MKSLFLSLAALAVLALVTSPSLAQQQRRGGGGGPSMYLAAKSVQEELKLSEEDAKKMTDELGKIARDATPEERAEKTKKILADGLKPEQLTRLPQIMWQKGGVAQALNNSQVQTALKLDDKQKEQVKSIRDESRKQIMDLGQGADRAKRAEIQKKANDDIVALLTDDQKKAWKELVGTEFKGEIPAPRRPNQPNADK